MAEPLPLTERELNEVVAAMLDSLDTKTRWQIGRATGRQMLAITNRVHRGVRIGDRDALNMIANILDKEDWTPDTIHTVSEVVRHTGRRVDDAG